MKYLIMECHLSYAVALDEDGRFLKVANQHYEVGQTVTDVIEMQIPQASPQKKKSHKLLYSLTAMAACMILMVTSVFQMRQITYASVYMTINPEVRIDVNRKDIVVGLEGVNTDGKDLIEGYLYNKKELDLVMDELVDRAIDMGYLHEGGQITLTLDADNNEWVISHSNTLTTHLNEHLSEKISVTIEVTDANTQNTPANQVIIPIAPTESNYDEPDYTESNYAESNYAESDYGTEAPSSEMTSDHTTDTAENNDTNYDDGQTDYGSENSQTDYSDTEISQSNYGDVEVSQSDYDDIEDSQSNYDDDDDSMSDYDD